MSGSSIPAKCAFFSIWTILILLCLHTTTHAEKPSGETWNTVETRHTILRYQSTEDLHELNNKIAYHPGRWSIKGLFSTSGPDKLTDTLREKVDAIFERVQEILDMRNRMDKIVINISRDRKHLDATFYEIFQKKCPFRAYYVFEFNTVYVTSNDIHEGMLAHELGHAIIDHYFSARPPRATAEILTRYIDRHLLD